MRQVRQFLEHEKDQKLADNAAERASCHVTAACTSHFKWPGYWTAVEKSVSVLSKDNRTRRCSQVADSSQQPCDC